MKNISQYEAIFKTEYQKQGVSIAFGIFQTPNFLAIGFEFKVGGELCKAIICNGKARRSERRKAIKALFLTFEYDQLKTLKFTKPENVRGAFIFSKSEAAK